MNWTGFVLRHWGIIALIAAFILGKQSCNYKAEAERHASNYEAIQQTASATARTLTLTNDQLKAENKRLLDSLNIKGGRVEFVYRTKWRTRIDSFEVEVDRWHIETLPCPIQSFKLDTMCMKFAAIVHPDRPAVVTIQTDYELNVVGYWERPGKWFGGKLWSAILGKKDAYVKISSPCFADSSVYLNKFSKAQ
jgi:hypothetical protein